MEGTVWEYHLEVFDTDGFRDNKFKKLDFNTIERLGGEGWEMVSAVGLIDQMAGNICSKTMRMALWFKRPIKKLP